MFAGIVNVYGFAVLTIFPSSSFQPLKDKLLLNVAFTVILMPSLTSKIPELPLVYVFLERLSVVYSIIEFEDLSSLFKVNTLVSVSAICDLKSI